MLGGYAYTLHDNTFEANWEIAEDKKGERK